MTRVDLTVVPAAVRVTLLIVGLFAGRRRRSIVTLLEFLARGVVEISCRVESIFFLEGLDCGGQAAIGIIVRTLPVEAEIVQSRDDAGGFFDRVEVADFEGEDAARVAGA